ncbi:MAG: DUF429 domain-containing protein [Chloroflexota bacterium]
MRIFGLDFTSAPSKRKPLTLASATLTDGVLRPESVEAMPSFKGFEALLERVGPWVCGMDFPFGQPLKLIENLNFPMDWQAYVELVEGMGKREWVATVDRYVQGREPGDKLHFRDIDRLAGAQSPMKMYFIPVGRMFYEGARRLAASEVSVMPNRPTEDPRTVVEVYPALVARRFVGRGSKYKSDDKTQQSDEAVAKRWAIVDTLMVECESVYGFGLELNPSDKHALVEDPTGDHLDALLCAVQAAWAYTMRHKRYGMPPDVNPLEGWIVDPELLEKYHG